MALYVVQSTSSAGEDLARARFHKDGFSWAAFIWGWAWLLYQRLWVAFLVWAVLEAAFIVAILPHVSGLVAAACDILARGFLGLEAQRLRIGRDARRAGFTAIVRGDDREDAESRFFRAHEGHDVAANERTGQPA